MKFLLLLLLPVFCQAQKIKTQTINGRSEPARTVTINGVTIDLTTFKYMVDTIKVKLLVSNSDNVLKVIDGYEKRQKYNEIEDSRKYKDYYLHIKYLDIDKKDLPNDIFVWQSKEVINKNKQ